jgi:hypothetical protein
MKLAYIIIKRPLYKGIENHFINAAHAARSKTGYKLTFTYSRDVGVATLNKPPVNTIGKQGRLF